MKKDDVIEFLEGLIFGDRTPEEKKTLMGKIAMAKTKYKDEIEQEGLPAFITRLALDGRTEDEQKDIVSTARKFLEQRIIDNHRKKQTLN